MTDMNFWTMVYRLVAGGAYGRRPHWHTRRICIEKYGDGTTMIEENMSGESKRYYPTKDDIRATDWMEY